jgi:hypothetical protein
MAEVEVEAEGGAATWAEVEVEAEGGAATIAANKEPELESASVIELGPAETGRSSD